VISDYLSANAQYLSTPHLQPIHNQHFQICIKTNIFILIEITTYKKQGGGEVTRLPTF